MPSSEDERMGPPWIFMNESRREEEDPVGVSPSVRLRRVSARAPLPINTSDVDREFARTNMATQLRREYAIAV